MYEETSAYILGSSYHYKTKKSKNYRTAKVHKVFIIPKKIIIFAKQLKYIIYGKESD